MNDLPKDSAAMALVNTIRRRIESRYRRILFVQKELASLNAAAQEESAQSKKSNAGKSFEDFVFSRIDFSVYTKIETEEFDLLFNEGLADYSEAFYKKSFNMNREEVREVIARSYIRVGPFYVCKKSSPLLLSIMRTLHTSLEFTPLLETDEAIARLAGVTGNEQLRLTAELLDGTVIRHNDNSETKLFMPAKENNGEPLLCGTFYPQGKPYTITLLR